MRSLPSRLLSIAFRVARAVTVAWLVLLCAITLGQRHLVFIPLHGEMAPAEAGLRAVSAGSITLPDGNRLVTWQHPAASGRPTLLYYHGNGGNLADRANVFDLFIRHGYGVFAVSYPGFSGSTGNPTEANVIAAGLAAYDTLRKSGVPASDIVLWGESLGTGVAIQVATQRRAAAVVLDAPYSSVVDVAADRFWYLPVRALMWDRFESTSFAPRVAIPTLILAGTQDEVIPVRFAQKLRDALPGEKRYVEYPTGSHLNLLAKGGFTEADRWIKQHHKAFAAATTE